jgi:hypothetical protein
MTTIYKLNGVSTGNTALPTIGDYGLLDTGGLTTLLKLKGAGYPNEGSAGGALGYSGNADGAVAPAFAGGIITCPDAFAASQYHMWNVPGVITSSQFTVAMLVRAATLGAASGRTMYLFRHSSGAGVNLYYNPSSNGLAAFLFNGTNRSVTLLPTWRAGEWASILMTVRSDRVVGIHNGGTPQSFLFSANGGAPSTSPAGTAATIGLNSAVTSFVGDIAGVIRFDRSMSDDELISLSRAMRVFAAKKGITV